MAIKLIKTERGSYDKDFRRLQISHFVVDSTDDFADLPAAQSPGSLAVAPNGDMMMVNASGEWVAFGG